MAGLSYILLAAALLAGICAVHGAVGGKKTNVEKAPWMVQLMYTDENGDTDKSISCAGVILSENHVLTATHCIPKDTVYFKNPSKHLAIKAGTSYKRFGGKNYKVKSVTRRFKATDAEGRFGWALIFMAEPIVLGKSAQAIALGTERMPDNTKVLGAGWGITKLTLVEPTDDNAVLLTVDMNMMAADTCKNYMMTEAGLDKHVAKALLCVKPNKKGMLCTGDTGSAVWAPAKGGQPAQLLGLLVQSDTCHWETGVPLFVDLVDPTVRSFLVSKGVPV